MVQRKERFWMGYITCFGKIINSLKIWAALFDTMNGDLPSSGLSLRPTASRLGGTEQCWLL
jgi:hypothetical protein